MASVVSETVAQYKHKSLSHLNYLNKTYVVPKSVMELTNKTEHMIAPCFNELAIA